MVKPGRDQLGRSQGLRVREQCLSIRPRDWRRYSDDIFHDAEDASPAYSLPGDDTACDHIALQRISLGDPRIDRRWICLLCLILKGTESSTWRSIHHFVQSGLFDPNQSLEDNAFELYSKVRLVRADLRSIEESELAWNTPGLAAAYEVKLQRSDGVQRYDESNDNFRWREIEAVSHAIAKKHVIPVDVSDRVPTELVYVLFFVEQPREIDDDPRMVEYSTFRLLGSVTTCGS
jgi:hypothetical protein